MRFTSTWDWMVESYYGVHLFCRFVRQRKDRDWQEIIDWSHLREAGTPKAPKFHKGLEKMTQAKADQSSAHGTSNLLHRFFDPLLPFLLKPSHASECHTRQACKGRQNLWLEWCGKNFFSRINSGWVFIQLAWHSIESNMIGVHLKKIFSHNSMTYYETRLSELPWVALICVRSVAVILKLECGFVIKRLFVTPFRRI